MLPPTRKGLPSCVLLNRVFSVPRCAGEAVHFDLCRGKRAYYEGSKTWEDPLPDLDDA